MNSFVVCIFSALVVLATGCGQKAFQNTRVIGGTEAGQNSWPWQVLLADRRGDMCGGTLIAENWVLTAAHCVYGKYAFELTVKAGKHDRRYRETNEQVSHVTKIIKHDGYNQRTMINDIALLKLSTPFMLNRYVKTACLPSRSASGVCYITGWGKMYSSGQMVIRLQQAAMSVVDQRTCNTKNSQWLRHAITPDMVCAGDDWTSRSGCHGDSGGPFVCQNNGVWEVHGAVSHGSTDCNARKTYTVFANAYYQKRWIQDQMRNN